MKTKKFTFDEISNILLEVRKAINNIQEKEFGRPDDITIYVPEYFNYILRLYFKEQYLSTVYVQEMPFSEGASFYGVKKFYPSPYNQIIVSTTTAPQKDPSITKIIQL